MDIWQLVSGLVAYFPVDVHGALFSAGDAHFAQGDGETCGTALEMGAHFTARFELLKGEARARAQTTPSFEFQATDTPVCRPPASATLAARNALRAMMDALMYDYEYTRDQAYIIARVAGDLRISSIVNVPHAQVTVTIPKSIFTN